MVIILSFDGLRVYGGPVFYGAPQRSSFESWPLTRKGTTHTHACEDSRNILTSEPHS